MGTEARISQREECNHQNNGGLTRFRSADYFAVSDGRPSSDNVEVLNRFGIEDMYLCLTSHHVPRQASSECWLVREGYSSWQQSWEVLQGRVGSRTGSSTELQSHGHLSCLGHACCRLWCYYVFGRVTMSRETVGTPNLVFSIFL